MKHAIYTDKNGYKYVTLIRDGDADDAAESGIPIGPPDLDDLDWDGAKRDINNLLVDRGLITFQDLQMQMSGLASAVAKPIMKRLIQIYKNHNHKE